MKHIRIIFFGIIVLFTGYFLFARNLRDYVGIVRPQVRDEFRTTFLNVSKEFEEKGYQDLADIFKAFAEGGHGSGFIYIDKTGGDVYIISNRHVMSQSLKVNVIFESRDGSEKIYEDCPVLYVDDVFDIGLIRLPVNKDEIKKGFVLDTAFYPDGTEIFSVGYPGLLGRPGWQYAKGIITNESAGVPEMVDPEISTVIQHSASIDPGNSGGPLLIKNSKDPIGFEVIGINTWKIENRSNTFFAQPAKAIQTVLKNAKAAEKKAAKPDLLAEDLLNTCNELAAALTVEESDFKAIKNYISYSFVGEKGWDSFIQVINMSRGKEADAWVESFFTYDPIETMRSALFYLIWLSIEKKGNRQNLVFSHIHEGDQNNIDAESPVRTIYTVDEKTFEITWDFEFGHWLIRDMKLEKFWVQSFGMYENPTHVFLTMHGGLFLASEGRYMNLGFETGKSIGPFLSVKSGLITSISLSDIADLQLCFPFLIRLDTYYYFAETGIAFLFDPDSISSGLYTVGLRFAGGRKFGLIELYGGGIYGLSTSSSSGIFAGIQLNFSFERAD